MFERFEWGARYRLNRLKRQFKADDLQAGNELDRQVQAWASRCAPSRLTRLPAPAVVASAQVGILASALSDVGGHTLCVRRLLQSLDGHYSLALFLSDRDRAEQAAPVTLAEAKASASVQGVSYRAGRESPAATFLQLYQQIVASGVEVLFVFTAISDWVAMAALALLRQQTRVKVVFVNHADHYFSLGMGFADCVVDFRQHAQSISRQRCAQSIRLPLQAPVGARTVHYDAAALAAQRAELGIAPGVPFTVTGCASNKLFEGDTSPYLEFIRELLTEQPDLVHLLLTELNQPQQQILERVFAEVPALRQRLLIRQRVNDFDILLQSADLFIDSFPQGSALVHIDMMRNRRPTVVRIDREQPLRSFEDYLYPDYPYAFADLAAMRRGIVQLLAQPQERADIAERLYQHYLQQNEFHAVQQRWLALVNDLRGEDGDAGAA